MSRLPSPGLDDGTWGTILNDYLVQSHNADGTLKANIVTATQLALSSVTSNAIAPGVVTNAKLDTATQSTLASVANKVDTADTRLTNARTPTAHATTHAAGGSDPISGIGVVTGVSWTDASVGGKVDGTTDNGPSGTNALAKAITALGANGGEIYIPAGTAKFTSQPGVIPSNIRIVGAGKNATYLVKAFNGEGLLRFEGASTTNRCSKGGLRDLQLNGKSGVYTGTLVTITYADHMNLDRVRFFDNDGAAIKATELWDTYFVGCEFDYCGGATNLTGAVVQLLGSTTDSTNEIYFVQCRWENFPGNALFVSSGSGGTTYGIYANQCKMENHTINGKSFIEIENTIIDVHFNDLYLAAIANTTPAPYLVNFIGSGFMTFANVHVVFFAGSTQCVFFVYAGNYGKSTIQDVMVEGGSLPNGIIQYAGGNTQLYDRNVVYASSSTTPIYTGTSIGGAVHQGINNSVSIITYGASITPDASTSSNFKVVATGSFTLNPPTSPLDGQMVLLEIRASAAVTVTIASAILLTTGQTATLAVASGKSGFIGLRYSSAAAAWYLLAASAG